MKSLPASCFDHFFTSRYIGYMYIALSTFSWRQYISTKRVYGRIVECCQYQEVFNMATHTAITNVVAYSAATGAFRGHTHVELALQSSLLTLLSLRSSCL